MKNVFVYAINTVNVGDDLFMQILFDRYPNTRMVMIAPDIYKTLYSKYSNVIVVSQKDQPFRRINIISTFFHLPQNALLYIYLFCKYRINLFLIIGGSLFMEGNSNMPSILKRMHLLKNALFPKLKIAILGSNYGPCKTDAFYHSVKQSLRYADDVCFRDKVSYDSFSDLPNVRWGNDIVLHLERERAGYHKKEVCINIRSVEKWPTLMPYKDKYLNLVKALISRFQIRGYSINLLSFCKSYGDDTITEELFNLLDDNSSVKKIYYEGNLSEVLNTISQSEYMIATRFHAIILSLVYQVKVLPISYSIKTENMLKTLGLWNDIYDFGAFCNSSVEDLTKCYITDYDLNKANNTQFNWLDSVLMAEE